MRSQQLEAAVTAFLEDAARRLQTDVDCGAEVGFEVERRGFSAARTPLYCYRPLTSQFMGERWRALGGLDTYATAVAQLERFDGLERYVRARAEAGNERRPGARGGAELGLWMLLEDVFAEHSDFELRAERVGSALEHLHRSSLAAAGATTVVATLHGMVISSSELPLTSTLRIAKPGALQEVPEEVMPEGANDELAHLLLVYTSDRDDPEAAGADGAAALRELLCALRLFGDGRVALGGLAWTRCDAGRWRPLPLHAAGRPHGMLVVTEAQEDELRAFCNLVSRRAPADNEIAWALQRFLLGCEREREGEALSDYLLALRVLLEPEGSARGTLAGRLAALCALPDERGELAALVARAIELERALIDGRGLENASSEKLVRTIGDHLRALLRDVICGHLDSDLATLADELLLEAATEEASPAPDLPPADARRREGRAATGAGGPEPAEETLSEDADAPPRKPQAKAPPRAPVRLGRDPMPDADPLDDDQLRLIGTPS